MLVDVYLMSIDVYLTFLDVYWCWLMYIDVWLCLRLVWFVKTRVWYIYLFDVWCLMSTLSTHHGTEFEQRSLHEVGPVGKFPGPTCPSWTCAESSMHHRRENESRESRSHEVAGRMSSGSENQSVMPHSSVLFRHVQNAFEECPHGKKVATIPSECTSRYRNHNPVRFEIRVFTLLGCYSSVQISKSYQSREILKKDLGKDSGRNNILDTKHWTPHTWDHSRARERQFHVISSEMRVKWLKS